MECKYNGSDRRLDYLFDNANHVEVDPIRTAGEAVADITIDGETKRIYAPAGGGGTDVEANPVGTPTADLDTIRIGQVIYGLPGGYTYLPVIYSEQEHEVGVWTDGKPLYQKSIHFSSPVTVAKYGTAGTTIVTIANIEQIVSSTYSTFQNGSSNEEKSLMFWIENNDIKASDMFSHQYYNSQFTDFTFQYTKTTDQPGSGTWTPDGEYAHHYSTSEKIVGTWIDGSTIYEVTLNVGAISAGQDKRVALPSDTDKIIDISGNAHSSNSNQWVSLNFPHQNITAYIVTAVYMASSHEINIHTGTDFTLDECYITVRYTKT